MIRIIEDDGTVVVGYILETHLTPIPYHRIRRFESLEIDGVSTTIRGNDRTKGTKQKRIGFGTEIVFIDDIKVMERM